MIGGLAHEPAGFDERLARVSGLGDQFEAFSRTVDFEAFRPDLEKALAYSDRSKGGRPSFDPVLMFNILVIQTLNNLSDERTEYLINDRLSVMRFLGLGLSDRVPEAKTVWLFRERLTQTDAIGALFNRFDATLRNAGYLPASGHILNAHRFLTLADAREKLEAWRRYYNEVRPHGAIGNRTPISLHIPGDVSSPLS